MSTSQLIVHLNNIKTYIKQNYWDGIKQEFANFKNILESVTNPLIHELSDLREFIKALDELLSLDGEQGKMLFQAKLEFLEVKIFVLENSLGKIPNATEDEDDLLETLEMLGVDSQEIEYLESESLEPSSIEITPSMREKSNEMKEQLSSFSMPSSDSTAKSIPQSSIGPPTPMTGPPTPMTGPPKPMTGPPKPMTGPPKPMTGPPTPMTPKPISGAMTSQPSPPLPSFPAPAESAPPNKSKKDVRKRSSFPETLKEIRSEEKLEEISKADAKRMSESKTAERATSSSGLSNILQRNTRISYYNQMNPESNYLLRIRISKKEIEQIQSGEVSHVYSSFEIEKTEDKPPIVRIIPFFPGCLVTPQQAEVNVEEELQDVFFYITPLVMGNIESCVEFWYEGKRIDRVETPTRIVTQTMTKIVATAGIVTGVVPAGLEFLNIDVNAYLSETFSQYWPQLSAFFSIYGILILELIIVASLIGVALFMFLRKKPKETEIEQ